MWEHCHGLDSLAKRLWVLEEKGWSELLGAVVGGGRGGLLPWPGCTVLVCPEGSGSTSPPSCPIESLTLPVTELL